MNLRDFSVFSNSKIFCKQDGALHKLLFFFFFCLPQPTKRIKITCNDPNKRSYSFFFRVSHLFLTVNQIPKERGQALGFVCPGRESLPL